MYCIVSLATCKQQTIAIDCESYLLCGLCEKHYLYDAQSCCLCRALQICHL